MVTLWRYFNSTLTTLFHNILRVALETLWRYLGGLSLTTHFGWVLLTLLCHSAEKLTTLGLHFVDTMEELWRHSESALATLTLHFGRHFRNTWTRSRSLVGNTLTEFATLAGPFATLWLHFANTAMKLWRRIDDTLVTLCHRDTLVVAAKFR